MGDNAKYTYLRIILISLIVLLAVSLFKNISYPLFWADESMTVMHGKRVLDMATRKCMTARTYFMIFSTRILAGSRQKPMHIGGANWLGYYVAAVGIKLADLTDDIYIKTAIIRTLFALFGLAGLRYLHCSQCNFSHTKSSKMRFGSFGLSRIDFSALSVAPA
jgi:hypothetical protein